MMQCRSCCSTQITSVIPLGNMPLANALLSHSTQLIEPTYNLEVMLCETCGLAQLKDSIDPKILFSEYVYFSSNSDAMLDSVAKLTKKLIPKLPKNAFVIEIASNDGYLLKNYIQAGINVLGIEPASNIAKVANNRGINTLCIFFEESIANSLTKQGKQADIIHANNVMAHIPDINGFIKGIKVLLKEDGIAIIEVPHLLELVKKLEFDTIYHEHVFYFSLLALETAFKRNGLEIFNIEQLSLHGGSLRLFVNHAQNREVQAIVEQLKEKELSAGLNHPHTYITFMKNINQLKSNLIEILNDLKSNNSRIAAYGASAKGTTLLNYFKIGKDMINFVVDRSPMKQGLYTPGTMLEILCPSSLTNKDISHALLLTWNFMDEIINQQKEFINSGGKFIIPIPEVRIVP